MSITNQLATALPVFQKPQSELGPQAWRNPTFPAPRMDQLLEDNSWLPDDSLLLGMGEDNRPLSLDVYDPRTGSILITGDKHCGKTAFLRMLAYSANLKMGSGEIQFLVLTHATHEWREVEGLPGCMGVWPAGHVLAARSLNRLIPWCGHDREDARTVVLLLIDGLDTLILSDSIARPELRWLFRYGPEYRIWTIATFNAGRLPRFASWCEYFGLMIFGSIRQPRLAGILTGVNDSKLSSLLPGIQFSLRKPEGWMKFWIPSIDERTSG